MPVIDEWTRDITILRSIAEYCNQISIAHQDFGSSRERFETSSTYQNAVAMCIMQIGELVKRLSKEFTDAHPSIPWRSIRGMRDIVAHEYGGIDIDIVWSTSVESIPELADFCRNIILL